MGEGIEESQTFYSHYEGRTTPVNIRQETRIAEGRFGEIFQADTEVGGRARSFVIKRFKTVLDRSPEENAARAMDNYRLAREAGLKVFPTYRLGDDKTSILMSNQNLDGNYCLSTNKGSMSLAQFGGSRMARIENFDEMYQELFSQAEIAAKKQIGLTDDCFFFFVDKQSRTKTETMVGDLDNLKFSPREDERTLYGRNLNAAMAALEKFIENNVTREAQTQYFSKALETYQETFRKNRLH